MLIELTSLTFVCCAPQRIGPHGLEIELPPHLVNRPSSTQNGDTVLPQSRALKDACPFGIYHNELGLGDRRLQRGRLMMPSIESAWSGVNASARMARDERFSLAAPSLITDTQQTYSPFRQSDVPAFAIGYQIASRQAKTYRGKTPVLPIDT